MEMSLRIEEESLNKVHRRVFEGAQKEKMALCRKEGGTDLDRG